MNANGMQGEFRKTIKTKGFNGQKSSVPKSENGLQTTFTVTVNDNRHCFRLNLVQKNLFKIALLGIAAAFVAIGIMRGEVSLILQKAVRICMECIGLG